MARPSLRHWVGRGIGLAVLLSATTAHPAAAQYFGQNKVQYRTFDFRTLQTPHFDIYFYPEEEAATRDAARMAERWYARLSRILDHEFEKRQPLILYASHPEFQQTNTLGGDISEGTGGVTEAFKQRVIMPFAYSYEETDHVLGHELVHAFQYDISGLGRAGGGIEAAARRFAVPGWFVEGMAEYLSVGPIDPLTAIWLRNAAVSGEIPTIRQLSSPSVFPYRYGQALWAYIGGRWGDAVIGQILKLAGQGVPYQEAFERVLGISTDDLSADWHAAIRRAYLPLLSERRDAREISRPLITSEKKGGRLNVGPALSPDGKWLVFLSELDFMDVELHLADAATGEVVRTLQKGSAFDPHFGSLRYIHSAGTWSPDSKQFAFGALRGGRDALVILDVARAKVLREIQPAGVGEIMNPTWSPDGRTIVFSGLSGGISDLFEVELASGRVRRLTDDRFTDLQPAFSPDGRSLAWVTDRFGTSLETLTYGSYRLGVMDVATGAAREVPCMAGPHNINPQWSRDGRALYFVSNRTGVPNVFRVEPESGALAQVTNVYSGVSGITDISPALSVARDADRLVFTAFEEKGFNLYSLTEARELAGAPAAEPADDAGFRQAALLPPVPRAGEAAFNRVSAALADRTTGLPTAEAAAAYPVVPYRSRLGLDYLGQPQVGVSAGGVFGGVGVYGGIAGIFSDVLGNRTVAGMLSLQGEWDEVGAAVQYVNTGTRLNYGVVAQRIPYVYGYYAQGQTADGGFAQQVVRMRYFDTSLQGLAQYPISAVQRVELSSGFRRISQDARIYEVQYDRFGQGVGADERKEPGVGFNMFESSAAWVYDDAVFGYTSPMAGRRARLEVTPVLGQLRFTTALADVRRYLFLRPFTLAVRGMTYGRYGRDSEGVFSDMYLGYPSLIRGYGDAYGQCADTGASCEVLNSLLGSRMALANAEIRFPLSRPSASGGGFQLPPIDAHLFYDAGVAWSAGSTPSLQPGAAADAATRGLLTSAGVGARVNLFGYAVLEVDYARAFQLDGSWRWVFALQPGF